MSAFPFLRFGSGRIEGGLPIRVAPLFALLLFQFRVGFEVQFLYHIKNFEKAIPFLVQGYPYGLVGGFVKEYPDTLCMGLVFFLDMDWPVFSIDLDCDLAIY